MNAPLKTTAEAATDFVRRHIGPSPRDIVAMLDSVGAKSLGELMSQTLPSSSRTTLPSPLISSIQCPLSQACAMVAPIERTRARSMPSAERMFSTDCYLPTI